VNRLCRNFGIFFNPIYDNKEPFLKELESYNSEQIQFYSIKEHQDFLPEFIHILDEDEEIHLDAILVFGGDGTILRSVPFALQYLTPLVGINLGNLGFLSEGNSTDLKKIIQLLLSGKYNLQSRMLIEVQVIRKKKKVFSQLSLNDAVIYKGLVPKLIDVKIHSNKRFVLSTRCDGVVISTPTGSTAYSLSAGGPILTPVMDAMIIAPLNPHILSVRPMIFSAEDNLSLKIVNTHEVTILQLDGQNVYSLQDNDEIRITKAKTKIQFVKISNRTFFQTLRRKMHMGKL
jgi:NAD+ kinase